MNHGVKNAETHAFFAGWNFFSIFAIKLITKDKMKRILLAMMALMALVCPAAAQNALNDKADNIVGAYSGKQGDDRFKVKIVKLTDGSYRGQVVWMEHDRDKNGNKLLDDKNPDKSLRSTPADRIVLFSGLKYNAKKHHWSDTKIYDPQRGIQAKVTIEFTDDGRLRVKGTVLGIGESVYWQKIQ